MLDAVLANINPYARIALCGMISQYNLTQPEGINNLQSLLINRAMIRGFIISEHLDGLPGFIADMTGWMRDGKLKYRETIAEGIDNAPAAFIGMLKGENFGKQIVRLGPDPA